MSRRIFTIGLTVLTALSLLASPASWAFEEAPDVLVQRLSAEVMDSIRADKAIQAGDLRGIARLVDIKIMPNVAFARMTASAVGRNWRQATQEQQGRLQEEFKMLLVRTYSGALAQLKDQTVMVRPLRAADEDTEVVVRTYVKGRGEPIQLDYRLEKTPGGWKIYDLNVLGVWLVDAYRVQFTQEISAKGIDGLIVTLAQRNKANNADRKPI